MSPDRRRSGAPRFAIRPGIPADLPRLTAIENEAFAGERLSQRALARHLRSPTASGPPTGVGLQSSFSESSS